MFVIVAVNRQRASSVDEKLCVIEQLNNGKTQANISSQKQNKITSYMRHMSPANPTVTEEPNFISAPIADPTFAVKFIGSDSELKFVFLTTKLTLILTLNN